MAEYNGWANYATWLVNLEWFDGIDSADYHDHKFVSDIACELQETVESGLEAEASGTALDYAMAFISDVDWREIAQHIYDEAHEDDEPEEEE